MKKYAFIHRRNALWLSFFVFSVLAVGALVLAVQGHGINPRAGFWSQVREGVSGYTAVASEAQKTLIQNGGQNWREIRNGLIAGLSPWILAGVFGIIMLFFLIVGQDKLESPRSGIKIKRFSMAERILHWTTASFFIILAVTGLSNLFGRAVLIPVFGQSPFAAYMQWALWTHNVCGPLFLAGVLIEFIVWVKDNIPRKMDVLWFKNLGGMVGKGPRPHAGKINGGEKAWFWVMVLAGLTVGVTGVILDFPIWGQSRMTMQVAHVIHASVAILFLAASFGHIYIGTIGAEGTFEGMWRGSVDAVWAEQHEDLWHEEKMKERRA
jgi:formate dehydrogenase subunit gamma